MLHPTIAVGLIQTVARFLNPACRHADRTISSLKNQTASVLRLVSAWRVVSEDSDLIGQSFLLIVRTNRIFTASY